jgi:NitT/TauT family transport system substrate-binding protein
VSSSPRFVSPRSFFSVSLLAFFVALALGVSSLAARPLRIAYTYAFPCVPLGIADYQGFWADAGLPVELRGYQTSREVVTALIDGEVDLAYDMIATWLELALDGAPIVIAGETDWSNGGDKLLLRQGRTLAAQKGEPIAVPLRGSALMLFLRESLAREGLAVPDFPLIEVPEQEKALQLFAEGKVHAVVSNEPWASRIEQAGAITVATTADFPGISPEGFAVRSAQVDDATLRKFFTVWFRTVAFLHDPAQRAAVAEVASIYAFAGTENITADDVAAYAQTTPVHDTATALRHNNLQDGNAHEMVRRFLVLTRLQGRRTGQAEIEKYFHLAPLCAVAAAATAP